MGLRTGAQFHKLQASCFGHLVLQHFPEQVDISWTGNMHTPCKLLQPVALAVCAKRQKVLHADFASLLWVKQGQRCFPESVTVASEYCHCLLQPIFRKYLLSKFASEARSGPRFCRPTLEGSGSLVKSKLVEVRSNFSQKPIKFKQQLVQLPVNGQVPLDPVTFPSRSLSNPR